jgi:ElaB/YqjD/DUF883 family membrane-anchored ribosome-binding protein
MTPNPMQGGTAGNAPGYAPGTSPGNTEYANNIREFQEDADEMLQSARRQLSEVLDGVSQRAREYGRYADEQVQANPWTAVGVGFGVGMAMGMLLAIVARR